MKKILIYILVLCILSSVLYSCNDPDKNISKLSGEIEKPLDQHSYNFNSYNELVQALTKKTSSKYSTLRIEQGDYGTAYQNTLAKFANGDIKVAIPQIDESEMILQNKDGYSKITLFTCELYCLPWIWYHCVVNDQKVTVRVSYLDAIYNVENSQNTTYAQILKSIAPGGAPSPENYQKYESYKSIYEKNIVLNDGTSVTAMISELKNDSNVYVSFYYDGLLIVLYGDGELFSDIFWSSFSFVYK